MLLTIAMVLYDKETTWGGSFKERSAMSYTIGITNQKSYYFLYKYFDILHSQNLVAMETLERYPDYDTIIGAILGLQCLKLSSPKYRF